MERRASLTIISVVIAASTLTGSAASGRQSVGFRSDLAFHFDCNDRSEPMLAVAIQKFLQENKFRSMDIVRARKLLNLEPMPSSLFIDGIDQERRIVEVMAEPFTAGTYTALLWSKPPTRHALGLEGPLISFVSDTLKCKVREVVRYENGVESSEEYGKFVTRIEDEFRRLEAQQSPRL